MPPTPTAHLEQLAVSPSGFVFDPLTGAPFSVNDTGRKLLEGLRDGASLQELIACLADGFETAGADLQRDVMEYVRQLCEAGLLPADFELG